MPRRDREAEVCDAERMDKKISELRERIEQTTRTKAGRKWYGADLRDDIVALERVWTRSGKSRAELARRLGMAPYTLTDWVHSRAAQTPARACVRPVRVLEPEPRSAAPTGTRSLLLGSGARIEGLTLDELITLARALA